jgi:poly-beta-hydroxyalkanoate depolymerase
MKATFELFEKTTKEYFNVSRDIRNISLDMLKKICDRTETKEISLDKFKNYLRDEGYCDPTIVYDGGNHPEYATNVFSTVDGFYVKNEIVIFDIEDDPHYDESRVNTVDII